MNFHLQARGALPFDQSSTTARKHTSHKLHSTISSTLAATLILCGTTVTPAYATDYVVSGGESVSGTILGDAVGDVDTLLVTGAGSSWNAGSSQGVGKFGTGTITVQSGGIVDTGLGGILGVNPGSQGTVTVTGAGSQWNNRALNLTVGASGNGVFNVLNGGKLTNSNGGGYLGGGKLGPYGGTGTVTVNGSGSEWRLHRELSIGGSGDGTLNIENGGIVINREQAIFAVGGGSSGTVTVTGAGSQWINNGRLILGVHGIGTLTVANGGYVSNVNAQLARIYKPNLTGTATVTGTGSHWSNSNLFIGGTETAAAGIGALLIADAGRVSVANKLTIWDRGSVEINGGTLSANTIDNSHGGSLTVGTSGTLMAVDLQGDLNNDAGTYSPGSSPAASSITGNYLQGASGTLQMELAGTAQGSEYDWLDVSGTATLAGELEILWYDLGGGLFNASVGDSFDLLTAETIIGDFDLLTLAVLGNGLGWDLSFLTDEIGSTDVLRLSVVSQVPVPAAAWLFGSALIGLVGIKRKK